MNKNLALLALTGVLTLASCGQNNTDPTCTTSQTLVNGVCVTSTGALTITNPNNYGVVVKDASGNTVSSTTYGAMTPGNYSAIFSQNGYISQTVPFTISAGVTTPVVAPTLTTVSPTTGAVQFVNPNGYVATVKDSNGTVVSAGTYTALAPGNYSVVFSADGYTSSASIPFSVAAGSTTIVTAPTLTATAPTTASRGAYYVDGNGNLVAIPAADLVNPDKFVFYAWMKNAGGTVKTTSGTNIGFGTIDPADRNETAPSFTQNLATAFVGYTADGTVYPVAGAGVRWTITGNTTGNPATTVIFGGADDGSNDTNFNPGVTPTGKIVSQSISGGSKQADTITNSAALTNTPFPTKNTNNPYYLNDATGVDSPNYNGLTWVTLFSPQANASAQVVAVASVGDMEIGKQVLNKTFAPKPNLSIKKEIVDGTGPNANVLTTGRAPVNTPVYMRITVTNTGAGAAQNVRVTDRLISGNPAVYSITVPTDGPTATAAQNNDGFDSTFNIAGADPVTGTAATQVFNFPVTATTADTYCDTATLVDYTNTAFTAADLQNNFNQSDSECATFLAPQVNVTKYFTDAKGNHITQAMAGDTSILHVVVSNDGGANATVTSVSDGLNAPASTGTPLTDAQGNVIPKSRNADGSPVLDTAGNVIPLAMVAADGTYTLSNLAPTTATDNGVDGFRDGTSFPLAPGQRREYTANVVTTADGNYCDTVAINSDGGNPVANACLTVVHPALTITKTNDKTTVVPGDNYTSTITVTNNGTGDATGVTLKDLLGNSNGKFVTFSSATYSLSGATATSGFADTANNLVYAGGATDTTFTIPAKGTLVLKVTSTLPVGATPGAYCDIASFTSTNAGNGNAAACVTTSYFAALQTGLKDTVDPIVANNGATVDGQTSYYTALVNQLRSNEAVTKNSVTFYFGSTSTAGTDATFNSPTATSVYYDANPVFSNGALVSDLTHAGAVKLTEGTDYTITSGGNGIQTITFKGTYNTLNVANAYFIVHDGVSAPAATAARQYWTNYTWTNVGAQSGASYKGIASEPTTVK